MEIPYSRYAVLDDLNKWRDPVHSFELLFAGAGYLYDRLEKRHGREAPLRERIRRLSQFAHRMGIEGSREKLPVGVSFEDHRRNIAELDELGTIGYGLWHLRAYEDSPAFRGRLAVLAAFAPGSGNRDTNPQLRGIGFEFVAAGTLARDGFAIEFIAEAAGEPRPDFFARRDGLTFPCEATSKYPQVVSAKTPDEFWKRLAEVARAKSSQLTMEKYPDGVLLVDCTPIFDAMTVGSIPSGGTAYYLPADGRRPGGSVPVIRYDESSFSRGLQRLQAEIETSSIRTLVLWNRLLDVTPLTIQRRLQYRVFGTLRGSGFWSYFPKAVVFPGPGVEVSWGSSEPKSDGTEPTPSER